MPEPRSIKDLRSFGFVVGGGFAIIGVWPLLWHALPVRAWALWIAAPLAVAAIVYPRLLRYPYRFWMLVGHCLGWVNTRILMTVMFYGVFTPAALVMRLFGRDALAIRMDRSATSYRVAKAPREASHLNHPF